MTTQGEKKLSTSDIAFTDRDIASNDGSDDSGST